MLDFMDYIQRAFADSSKWNHDNSYSALTASANALLDFSTPERLRVHISSLSTPQFATTYTLGTVGLIDGSISYLFSSLPLDNTPSRSALIPLRHLVPGYRQVYPPFSLVGDLRWDGLHRGAVALDNKAEERRTATLLHATLHLPPPTTLTALFLRRLSPTTQLSLAVCSTRSPPTSDSAPEASLLTQISHDTGKYSSEFLFSTDNALFGFKGLWNFGPDPREVNAEGANNSSNAISQSSQALSLLSAGGEAYYSPISSVVGMSTGLRFATLPAASESPHASSGNQQIPSPLSTFPYTLTLTLTPLTGSLSTTYSLLASPNVAFSSRFGFNVYSWESEMVAGCEVWRRKRPIPVSSATDNLVWARRKMGLHPSAVSLNSDPSLSISHHPPIKPALFPDVEDNIASTAISQPSEYSDSVIKIRVDHSWNIRVLWEGRVKELLVSAGVGLGTSSRSALSSPSQGASGGSGGSYGWTGVGVSVLYSS